VKFIKKLQSLLLTCAKRIIILRCIHANRLLILIGLKNSHDWSFETKTTTTSAKTKTKTAKCRSRDQDCGLKDYISVWTISSSLVNNNVQFLEKMIAMLMLNKRWWCTQVNTAALIILFYRRLVSSIPFSIHHNLYNNHITVIYHLLKTDVW